MSEVQQSLSGAKLQYQDDTRIMIVVDKKKWQARWIDDKKFERREATTWSRRPCIFFTVLFQEHDAPICLGAASLAFAPACFLLVNALPHDMLHEAYVKPNKGQRCWICCQGRASDLQPWHQELKLSCHLPFNPAHHHGTQQTTDRACWR